MADNVTYNNNVHSVRVLWTAISASWLVCINEISKPRVADRYLWFVNRMNADDSDEKNSDGD